MNSKQNTNENIFHDSIKRAVIEIEGGCNLMCQMCPQQFGRGSFNAKIEFDVYKRLVDECIALGVEVIQLDGSGEATLNKDLAKFIEYPSKHGVKVQIYSNGTLMAGDFMKACVDAGLSIYRFSMNGFDRESYEKVTGFDYFDTVLENAINMKKYILETNSSCTLASYHLIMSNDVEKEIKLYQENFINKVDSSAEIWKMHNWAGSVDINVRKGKKRTCGRPSAPEITIRAGGIEGHRLAVVPCCQVLGRDEESVLEHCDDKPVLEAFNSERYNWLRKMHKEERFDEIDICKNCDFLYDDDTVLIWSNKKTGHFRQMNGLSFKL